MNVQTLVVSFAVLTGLLVASEALSRGARLPVPTTQFLLGALAAHALVAAGFDTGLRFDGFPDLVFHLFLPVLVFAVAFQLDPARLAHCALPVASLVLVGLVTTTGLVAVGLYYGIGHPSGFPWPAALLTGALLAATDPAAVTDPHRPALQPEQRSRLLLEGESLLSDVSAIVLFTGVLALALGNPGNGGETATRALALFAAQLGIGALTGMAAAGVGFLVLRGPHPALTVWVSLSVAMGGYHAAEFAGGSGVVACLICGLLLGRKRAALAQAESFWHLCAGTANGMLFLLMGATLTLSMFTERWLAMLIAIVSVIVARFAGVALALGPLRWLPGDRIGASDSLLLGALGMRGAVALALVLMLPVDLPYWWTVQSIVYGVVLFDLLITAPLAPRIANRLGH